MTKPRTVTDFHGPSRSSGNQVCYRHCPVCGSDKWKVYVNPVTGAWYCFAGQHSGGGKVDVGMGEHRGQEIRDLLDGKHQVARPEWPEVTLPTFHALSTGAERYLERRGLIGGAKQFGLVEMADSPRILIPYRGPNGRYVYWSSRSYSVLADGPKYLAASGKHPLYVLPRWRAYEDLVLVEGAFDAMAVYLTTGRPVAALGGKSLPKYLEPDLMEMCTRKLTIMLDGDALAGALGLARRLSDRRLTKVVPLRTGDDPASLGAELAEVLK